MLCQPEYSAGLHQQFSIMLYSLFLPELTVPVHQLMQWPLFASYASFYWAFYWASDNNLN